MSYPNRILALALLGPLAAPLAAQATVRPIPRVARSWESVAVPAAMRIQPPASDLDFIGPLAAPDSRQEGVIGAPRESEVVNSTRFVDVQFHGAHVGASSFEQGLGSITTQRGGWKAAVGDYDPTASSFAVEIGTEASFYDFGGGSPVPGVSDPFNDVYDTSLAGRFLVRSGERFEWYGGVQLGVSGEDAADLGDSLYAGGALALRYQAVPEFAFLVGVAGLSRYEDSAWILPYIGFDWRASERLRVLVEAAEIHIDYRVSESWNAGLLTVYDLRQYRLNDEGPLHGGAFRDEDIRAGATLGWKASDNVRIELEAGKVIWRETRFYDGQSGLIGEFETSSPTYLRLGLRLSF